MTDWSALRRRCQRRVDHLFRQIETPHPWDINTFLDRLEGHFGREIDLCAVRWLPGQSTGAWQRHEDFDVIAYPENTSDFHQDHVILHELAHMLCGHRGQCVLSETEAQQLAPSLAPAAFTHLLTRSSTHAEEHEAELTAMLIHQRGHHARPHVRPRAGDRHVDRVLRAAEIFGA